MFAIPVSTFRVDYDYEGDEDIEKVIRTQFDAFITKHVHLVVVDYIVMKTGFTRNLMNDTFLNTANPKPLVIYDEDMRPPMVSDSACHSAVRKVCCENAIVFDEAYADSVFFLVKYLKGLDYCMNCTVDAMHEISWFLVDQKMIMVVNIFCSEKIYEHYFYH